MATRNTTITPVNSEEQKLTDEATTEQKTVTTESEVEQQRINSLEEKLRAAQQALEAKTQELENSTHEKEIDRLHDEHEEHDRILKEKTLKMKRQSSARVQFRLKARQALRHSKTLSSISLFQDLPSDSISKIIDSMDLRTFDVAQNLVVQGEPSAEFMVIITGAATVFQNSDEIRRFGALDFLGEGALIDEDHIRGATVTANAQTQVLVLGREKYQELLNNGTIAMATHERAAALSRSHSVNDANRLRQQSGGSDGGSDGVNESSKISESSAAAVEESSVKQTVIEIAAPAIQDQKVSEEKVKTKGEVKTNDRSSKKKRILTKKLTAVKGRILRKTSLLHHHDRKDLKTIEEYQKVKEFVCVVQQSRGVGFRSKADFDAREDVNSNDDNDQVSEEAQKQREEQIKMLTEVFSGESSKLDLSESDCRALAQISEKCNYTDCIVQQGKPLDCMFIIEEGVVVSKNKTDKVTTLGPKDFFGLDALSSDVSEQRVSTLSYYVQGETAVIHKLSRENYDIFKRGSKEIIEQYSIIRPLIKDNIAQIVMGTNNIIPFIMVKRYINSSIEIRYVPICDKERKMFFVPQMSLAEFQKQTTFICVDDVGVCLRNTAQLDDRNETEIGPNCNEPNHPMDIVTSANNKTIFLKLSRKNIEKPLGPEVTPTPPLPPGVSPPPPPPAKSAFVPLIHPIYMRMLFIPKSFMSPAGFRDHMFKTQLRTKSEYWPKTLQRENEGIYLRVLKPMNKWGSKSKLDIQLSVPDDVSDDTLPEYATNVKLIDQGIICKTMYGPYELSVPNRSVSLPIFVLYLFCHDILSLDNLINNFLRCFSTFCFFLCFSIFL